MQPDPLPGVLRRSSARPARPAGRHGRSGRRRRNRRRRTNPRRADHGRLHLATALAVLAAIVAGLVAGAQAAPTIPPRAIRIEVGGALISRPVPPGFVGLSIEYRSVPYYFGPGSAPPNPLFAALVRQLAPGQAPVLRIGGDTTDWTWWDTPGVARPGGVRYTLGRAWVRSLRAGTQALGARLILGLNFEADSAAITATEARALLDGIGPQYIAGLELGNEPEVYGTLGWYQTAAGKPVPGRPSTYRFSGYLHDWHRISAAVPAGVPLVGPASGAPRWLAGLGRYLGANPRVRMATFHRYPLNRCFTKRRSAQYPTIAHLLAPAAWSGLADSLQAAVRTAHARDIPLRVDELNSVACGGKRGISDTFASSLWALDSLFGMARVGVDGVNMHTFRKAIYAPFAFARSGGRWTAEVKPFYYGMFLFARAAPPGSRLLSTGAPAGHAPRVWATRAPDGRVRVVLINDSPHTAVTAAVRLPIGAGHAMLQRLRAPSLTARRGITLGGQSFGTITRTGTLSGPARQIRLSAIQGRFVARLPPASATLLTAGRRQG